MAWPPKIDALVMMGTFIIKALKNTMHECECIKTKCANIQKNAPEYIYIYVYM